MGEEGPRGQAGSLGGEPAWRLFFPPHVSAKVRLSWTQSPGPRRRSWLWTFPLERVLPASVPVWFSGLEGFTVSSSGWCFSE